MQPSVSSELSRHLQLAGTYNVRDIGGYRTRQGRTTRWRMLFRADSLHRLPPEAQIRFLDHGVRTVIDLRRTDELEVAPNVFSAATRVTYRHMSLLPDKRPAPGEPRPLVDMYRHMLDERAGTDPDDITTASNPGGIARSSALHGREGPYWGDCCPGARAGGRTRRNDYTRLCLECHLPR